MSIKAISWAWQQDVGLPSMKLVLVALADHAKDTGECWPSISRIADMTNLSRATVFRSLEHLTGLGLIQQVSVSGKVNHYCLALPDPSHGETPITSDPSHGETPTRLTVRPHPSHGETDPSHGETRTVKNHKEPPLKERAEPKQRLPDDWQPDAKLLAWAKERAPHVDTTTELEKFIDFFCHIKPDRRTGEGWRASWRTWLMRARRDYTPAAARFPTRSERTSQRNAAIIGDALADRPSAHDGLRDIPGTPFRLIDGSKA